MKEWIIHPYRLDWSPPLSSMVSGARREHQEAAIDGLLSAGCPVDSGLSMAGFIVQYQSIVLLLRTPRRTGTGGKEKVGRRENNRKEEIKKMALEIVEADAWSHLRPNKSGKAI